MPLPQPLPDLFRYFAERCFRGSSPLYERLSLAVAEDPELLELASKAQPGQLPPNMLFGAVHDLLLRGDEHPLRYFYPSLTPNPGDPELAVRPFKAYCRARRGALARLIGTRRVQTNEVNRCAFLYPAFCLIHRDAGKPLALVEAGASAGLNLLWDRYAYDYGTGGSCGSPFPALALKSEPRGGTMPFLCRRSPPVAARVGIDLRVSDLRREDDYRWLQALVWPEHRERRTNLAKAAACLKAQPPLLVEGDAIALLGEAAAEMPGDAALVVFHTHVANQFSPEEKQAFLARLEAIAEQRAVYHLYNNMGDALLRLDRHAGGRAQRLAAAETDAHGRWFRWLDAP
ncbi:hypothetical protein SAMN02799624_00122 [Paenibacillus sp. UNC496MF]|uniref:DUF2332 domain-containing protein n=1 Tax=Paenibacillus sp. UNC496MF TaxID=1502753 RepID=UPI0008F31D67|nr:DUF2332 domain-containing protein [Paenibacillus sp. UNC496MF]SFI28565.1 hypothetical protein SAMN02799624_00122 [Paenibacillus sp. UNC496MF]